ncbi:MAG: hypothetical protein DWQ05_12610 [Calditrichaeota bacterium]|nr:MAG: hypothetical protein DWQ05_12610 [Calditrichota bacterium]
MKIYIFLLMALFLINSAPSANAQEYSQKEFDFLTDLQQKGDKKLSAYFIAECEHYLKAYPFSEKAPDVLLLLGNEQMKTGADHEALASLLKLKFIYPEFAAQNDIVTRIKKFVDSKRTFAKQKEKIVELSATQPTAVENAERYFNYLETMSVIAGSNMKKMLAPIVTQAYYFHTRFPDDARRDSLSIWVADIYRLYGKDREAASEYLKFEFLFKTSRFLPYARYQRGLIFFEELKQPQTAIDIFQIVATEHKGTKFGSKAQFATGRVYEEKLKDYATAVAAYRKVATDFQEGDIAVLALEKVANIQEKRFSAYADAIKTYHEIQEKYTGHVNSPRFLVECAELYLKRLKDYNAAATHFAYAAERFPKDENAPDYWIAAGEILDRRLNDYKQALEYYQQVIEKYPDHKKAREAQKKIDKVEKKLAPQEENASNSEN